MLQQQRTTCSLGLTTNPNICSSCFMFLNFLILFNVFVYSYISNVVATPFLCYGNTKYKHCSLFCQLPSGNVVVTLTLHNLYALHFGHGEKSVPS